jgi:toxin-antitoxin system PIN domain toxin
MIHLLDINVLIALCDPAHPHAHAARQFFQSVLPGNGWATCPLVENGFLRIFGDHRYRGGPGSPQAARLILEGVLASPGHQFWPDDLSLSDNRCFPSLPSSQDLTNLYLLGLAVKRGGRFATFDRRIDPTLVPGGQAACFIIGDSISNDQ